MFLDAFKVTLINVMIVGENVQYSQFSSINFECLHS